MKTNEIITDKRFNEIWGLDSPQSRDQIIAFIHPDDLPIRNKALREGITTGEFDYEARLLPPGTGVRWIRSRGHVYLNEKGEPFKIFGVVQNITKQKNFAEELQQSASRLRLLSESIPQIVWSTTPDGNLDYFSSQWWDCSGMSLEQSVGQGWAKAIHVSGFIHVWS